MSKILLIILIILISINFVLGASVCCEKVNNGGFCENTDETNCNTAPKDANDLLKGYWGSAATSCALTSFCKPGCCFNPDEGLCYGNQAKAVCESNGGIFDANDVSCDRSAQCQLGCCVIGSEAGLMTEAKCRIETSKFPSLAMDFKTDITDEIACINTARKAEKGCCVKDSTSCVYESRSLCTETQSSSTGFFSGKYCSELTGVNGKALCNCVKGSPRKTGCIADSDDIYYFDSCGNAEEKAKECDYVSGTSCGDSDKNGVYDCESLNCDNAKSLLFDLKEYYGSSPGDVLSNGGVLNGESWCMYNSERQDKSIGGRDPPGSRYYRGMCINGKIVVEPCEDYRKEWCVDAPINVGAALGGEFKTKQLDFYEGRCRENRWQSCIDSCNTLNNVEAGKEGDFMMALRHDFDCCMNVDLRDCKWVGPSETTQKIQAYGKGKYPLFCVPFVPAGYKFWESEGTENCGKASLDCEVGLHCPGTGVLLGYLAGKKCAGGKITRLEKTSAGQGKGGVGGEGSKNVEGETWTITYGEKCLTKEWVQSANDLCRSIGDCGADVNLMGRVSYSGFSNTPKISNDFYPYEGPGFLKDIGLSDGTKWGILVGNYNYKEKDKGKLSAFFKNEKGGMNFEAMYIMSYALVGGLSASPKIGGLAGGKVGGVLTGLTGYSKGGFFAGVLAGFSPISWIQGIKGAFGKAAAGSAAEEAAGSSALTKVGWASQEAYDKVFASYSKNYDSYSSAYDNLVKVQPGMKNLNPNEMRSASRNQIAHYQDMLNPEKNKQLEKTAETEVNDYKKQIELNENFLKEDQKLINSENKLAELGEPPSATAKFLHTVNTIMWIWQGYKMANILLAKDETVTIKTVCSPWVAPVPTRGTCEQCNPGNYYTKTATGELTYKTAKGYLKCGEYTCKSFGASCGIVNEGTDKQMCVSKEPSDVKAPLIDFWKEGTSKNILDNNGLRSETPRFSVDLTGYKIPAYDKVVVGIKTDEPSQCKMSFKPGVKYDQMEPYFFGDATYDYTHSGVLMYPNNINVTSGDLKLGVTGKIYELYVRCQDANGNGNDRDYVIKFDIQKGPDLTAPVIEGTSMGVLPADVYVSLGKNETDLILYVSEMATCRWGNSDVSYDVMPVSNECTTGTAWNSVGLYECRFDNKASSHIETHGNILSGIGDSDSKEYYFKCKDQPQCIDGKSTDGASCTRIVNTKSASLTLKKSYALNITEIIPNGTFYVGKTGGNITMEMSTEGGAERNGNAYCGFTTSKGAENNIWAMSAFMETNSSHHTQVFSQLSTGSYTYYVGCIDIAGNTQYGKTEFKIQQDTEAPRIIRTWVDSTSGSEVFKIRTNEKAICEYSTEKDFVYGEGNEMLSDDELVHSAQGGAKTYYVICKDNYENMGTMITVNFLI